MLNTLRKCSAIALMAVLAAPAAFAGADPGAKPEPAAAASTATPSSATITISAEEFQAMRDAIASQQKQIDELRQEIVKHDQEPGGSAADAGDLGKLKADVADLKANQTSAALQTQDEQKRAAAIEGTLGRFRLSGDVRVRGEAFHQKYSGCSACFDRWRSRIRVRLGIDGKLNEDFTSGIYLASGAWVSGAPDFKDPVSTNETMTGFFERKTIGIDRAWVTYQPHQVKWLSVTGGKWAYSWNRTLTTFDSDLNPEGFNEKVSFDLNNKIVKNISAQAIQILFNEVSAGTDSNAAGGSFSARLQLGKYVTFTPTYTLLNWNGADAIAQAASPVTLPQPNTPAVGTPLPQPTTQPIRVINANAMTNATAIVGAGVNQKRVFVSGFEYSDFIGDLGVKTPWAKYPLRFLGEYEKNLRARRTPLGNKGDTAYYVEFNIGQARNKHDLLFGYSYSVIEQDAVISQFNESDYRAPTNVQQHRLFANWLPANNTTLSFTWFIGRTDDVTLQNALKAPGLPAGMRDPWLNRLQFDVIYKF